MAARSSGTRPAFAARHPATARLATTAILLGLVALCVGALVTSWSRPHAPLMAGVGVLVAVTLQLVGYRSLRGRARTSSAISLGAGVLAVLSASFVCVGSGWLRAFGAGVLLPFLLGATFIVVASLPRLRRASLR